MPGHRLLLTTARYVGRESGFGLVEMLIALTLIVIGIGAVLSVFASATVSLQHGARQGTALSLADRQVEAYRSMSWTCIPQTLSGTSPAPPTPADCATPFGTGFPNPYAATQTVSTASSPDHHAYTVTTSVTANAGGCGGNGTAQITVNVTAVGLGQTLATETTCFSSAGTAPSS